MIIRINLSTLTLIGFIFCLMKIEPIESIQQRSLSEKNIDKEQQLIKKLLKPYSKKQKPHGTIQIKFALNLNQVVTVKAKDQIFTLNVFLDHEWTDNRLIWGEISYYYYHSDDIIIDTYFV